MEPERIISEINSILNRWQEAAFLRHVLTLVAAADKAWCTRGRAEA